MQSGPRPEPAAAALAAISATFTADLLKEPLSFWLGRLGLDLPVRFAPYNQVFQQLLDPASLLAQNRGGHQHRAGAPRRLGALPGGLSGKPGEPRGERPLSGLLPARRGGVFLLPAAGFCLPLFPGFLEDSDRVASARAGGGDRVQPARRGGTCTSSRPRSRRSLSGGRAARPARRRARPRPLHARVLHRAGHPPRPQDPRLADDSLQGHRARLRRHALARHLRRGRPGRRRIDPPRQALQEFMVAQHDAGMLLCLCSKNNEEDVLETFRGHPGHAPAAGALRRPAHQLDGKIGQSRVTGRGAAAWAGQLHLRRRQPPGVRRGAGRAVPKSSPSRCPPTRRDPGLS